MPELPDLVYIVKHLAPEIAGRTIASVKVKQPIVIRMLSGGGFADTLAGRAIASLERHGPFLVFDLGETTLTTHLMLSGHWQLATGSRPTAHECFALGLDDGRSLRYGDETRMGRVYVGTRAQIAGVPGFAAQGIDPTDSDFTLDAFRALIRGKRCQVRVFVMDQALISAVGNAYADEILFAAGLHPKTRCNELDDAQVHRFHAAVVSTLRRGIDAVEAAAEPVHVKVRGHMLVRNRKGEPCPACGATIRRAAVLGYDTFFCPSCQPEKGGRGIPWTSKDGD
jgi:formamidopyrimidine-DNA glycosylase